MIVNRRPIVLVYMARSKWSCLDKIRDRKSGRQLLKAIVLSKGRRGYLGMLSQTQALVVNPIKVNSFAYLFNCTTVGRTSD